MAVASRHDRRASRSATSSEIRAALRRALRLLRSLMQAPKLVKITLNMGVGDAKQDSKMLEAAQEQLATIAGQAPEHPPRPQVDRRLQAPRRDARGRGRDPARRAHVRVPRPPDLRGPAARARLPRAEPACLRRPRQLRASACASRSSSPRSTTTRSTRSAGLDIAITTTARDRREAFVLLDASSACPSARRAAPGGARSPSAPRRGGGGSPSEARARGRPSEAAYESSAPRTPRPYAPVGAPEAPATSGEQIRRGAGPWPRRPSWCARSARRSTRRATTTAAAVVAAPRAYLRKFGLCRICLREVAHEGYVPGLTKSSW